MSFKQYLEKISPLSVHVYMYTSSMFIIVLLFKLMSMKILFTLVMIYSANSFYSIIHLLCQSVYSYFIEMFQVVGRSNCYYIYMCICDRCSMI
jgi:hypothetical protein